MDIAKTNALLHTSISAVPKEISKYLDLKNTEESTGHYLRRTSEKLLIEEREGGRGGFINQHKKRHSRLNKG